MFKKIENWLGEKSKKKEKNSVTVGDLLKAVKFASKELKQDHVAFEINPEEKLWLSFQPNGNNLRIFFKKRTKGEKSHDILKNGDSLKEPLAWFEENEYDKELKKISFGFAKDILENYQEYLEEKEKQRENINLMCEIRKEEERRNNAKALYEILN